MSGPLAGILVVDLSRALAGPHAGMTLGDLGARVIKVEPPHGDETRQWGPPFVGPEEDSQSTYFLSCNRNKESIVLDLKDNRDLEVFLAVIEKADVLVENFRSGVMDRLGLSTDRLHRLNPRLIVLSITGFGHEGPDRERAGYDQIVQGEAGLMSLTGQDSGEPQRVGVPISDLLAGIYGAAGVLAALVERGRTGEGKVVRTSLLASTIGVHAFQGTRYTVAGEVPLAAGNHHPSIAPYGMFRCRNGSVQISVGNESLWRTFAHAFGIDSTARGLASNSDRVRNRELTIATVERAFADVDAGELLARLNALGIPAGRVRTLDEVYAWDQVLAQRLLLPVEHPTLGKVNLPGSPLRFFDPASEKTPERETTRSLHQPPPLLNEHSDVIRSSVASR